jgi:nitroreductase
MSTAADDATALHAVVAAKAARALDDRALRTLFTDARAANAFLPQPVPRELIEDIYRLSILGMTASNALPMRLVIIDSDAGKERLLRSGARAQHRENQQLAGNGHRCRRPLVPRTHSAPVAARAEERAPFQGPDKHRNLSHQSRLRR